MHTLLLTGLMLALGARGERETLQGGFGQLDGDARSWTLGELELSTRGQRVTGTLRTNGDTARVRGQAERDALLLEVELDGERRELSLDRVTDGLSGGTLDGALTCRFVSVRDASPEITGPLLGCWRAESGPEFMTRSSGSRLLLLELESGQLRALFPRGEDRFSGGPAIGVPLPVEWEARIERDAEGAAVALLLRTPSTPEPIRAARVATPQTEPVSFESDGVTLRGTLFLPPGDGPHPAAVYVHGSGRQTRASAGYAPTFLSSRGVACLAVDKRGVGASSGRYELPDGSHDNLPHMRRRAGDVRAALSALEADARIATGRVGLIGGSQAGWVIPIAAADGGVAFTVILSGGATALSHEGVFSELTDEMDSRADAPTIEHVLRRTRARRARDPDIRAELAAMDCPALWLYGDQDRSNPSALCAEEIEAVRADTGNDFTIRRWPEGTHSLLVGHFGGGAEVQTLDRQVPDLWQTIEAWLSEKQVIAALRSTPARDE